MEWQRMMEQVPVAILPTQLRDDPLYQRFYMLAANATIMVFLPLVSLIILNWKIHKAIQNREHFRCKDTYGSFDKNGDASKSVAISLFFTSQTAQQFFLNISLSLGQL